MPFSWAGLICRVRRRRAWRRWAAALLPSALLLGVGLALATSPANQGLFMLGNAWSRTLPDAFWSALTLLGTAAGAFALFGLLLRARPQYFAAGMLAALPGSLYSYGLKRIMDLPRPAAALASGQFHQIGEVLRHHAFPSGHALTAFAFAGIVLWLPPRRRVVPIALAVALAAAVAVSRIAVGAHWPADLLAGAAGGWLAAAIGVAWSEHWRFWECRRGVVVMATVLAGMGVYLCYQDLGYPLAGEFQYGLAALAFIGCVAALLPSRPEAARPPAHPVRQQE
ncbi:MAG: hypothetical protein IOMNBAOH_00879 [Rhodocyclaceae bacterium]|nr:hypothetical protein [Rhodocyclaceae bacterium]